MRKKRLGYAHYEDTLYEDPMVLRRTNCIGRFFYHGIHLSRVAWTFNKYDEKHGRGTRQKKESNMSRLGFPEEASNETADPKRRPHLFDSTILPVLYYAAEKWPDTSTTSKLLQELTERSDGFFRGL
ncbi:hypothetical protein KIN20_009070 [Parelaphostrongylus tenuis]|uniref:Uncharacterized protein n=1 Tax=Parelaphostrongylus tenuis TaxID=148309 RepID=A0AAD5MS35_PARTN|nr:hypothetical protein KIN20_009070 [Parelaphostrongylus tenuis]